MPIRKILLGLSLFLTGLQAATDKKIQQGYPTTSLISKTVRKGLTAKKVVLIGAGVLTCYYVAKTCFTFYSLWKKYLDYPNVDIIKCNKEFFLYKIEKDGHPPSYLYGVCHVRLPSYKVPQLVKDLVSEVNILVTEVDHTNKDEDLITLKTTFFNKILDTYGETANQFIKPYIDQIEKYKKDNKLIFLFHNDPFLSLKYKGEVKYEEEELYNTFTTQKRDFLETTRELHQAVHFLTQDFEEIGKKAADSLCKTLAKYSQDTNYREKVLKQLSWTDDNAIVTEKQLLSRLEKLSLAIKPRNETWFRKISQMIEGATEKGIFFAVGAVHLPHLLSLFLDTKEYKITRILDEENTQFITSGNCHRAFV